jgi:hypothetical protein
MKKIKTAIQIIILALILAGSATFAQTYTPPSAPPPGGNVAAPVNVGSVMQDKNGILGTRGFWSLGTGWFSTSTRSAWPPSQLTFGVNGSVGAVQYCNDYGNNCFTADQVGGGGSNISGTPNTLAKFDSVGNNINDSAIKQIGSQISIGGNIANATLDVTGTGRFSGKLTVRNDIEANAFLYSSDQKLKTNIKTLTNALDKVLSLRGVVFNWKKDGTKNVGLIAQEVEEVYPELVEINEEGMKSVAYGNLVPVLIEAIKEQQKEIDALKAEIEKLK